MDLKVARPIIAVTGSAGKTMTKTMISSILRERWVIFESKDYQNLLENTKEHASQIGFIHRAAVLEYGMAFAGTIAKHCSIIQPTIGVITNVGLAHIGNFNGDVKQLAAAKSELIKGMDPSGILVINQDDCNSRLLHTDSFKGRIFTVGIETEADYQAKDIGYSNQGMTFKLTLGKDEFSFVIPVLGKHNVYNALFAIAVADQLGFLPIEMQTGLCNMKKPNHRLDVYCLKDGITIIDDTVHAHPPAVKAAIDVLDIMGKGKKIAVLGNMPGLGERSKEYHEEIGRYIASRKIDILYTYGSYSEDIGVAAVEAGFPQDKVYHKKAEQRKLMHEELIHLIEPGSTILVKGARRLEMYETVRFLWNNYKIDS